MDFLWNWSWNWFYNEFYNFNGILSDYLSIDQFNKAINVHQQVSMPFSLCHFNIRSLHSIGGGRVTRFPFSPLNVFVYISHWTARVNYQNRPHFQGDYRNWWLTRALLGAIQLAASRSNMIAYFWKIGTRCNWIWYRFYTWSLQPKYFCMVVTGTLRQSVGFPGAIHSNHSMMQNYLGCLEHEFSVICVTDWQCSYQWLDQYH